MAERSFDAMRQDAIRRSREMQRRAVPPVQETPPPVPEIPAPPEKPQKPGLDLGLQGLLSDWDAEKLALAGLLWVLYREGADPALLLALAYILL
ncbi:MAG: hypothetical protein J5851_05105 [Oscillospiraceae bacterium]|nr:hypothetical protein [Oscillospiraceae bacterium]